MIQIFILFHFLSIWASWPDWCRPSHWRNFQLVLYIFWLQSTKRTGERGGMKNLQWFGFISQPLHCQPTFTVAIYLRHILGQGEQAGYQHFSQEDFEILHFLKSFKYSNSSRYNVLLIFIGEVQTIDIEVGERYLYYIAKVDRLWYYLALTANLCCQSYFPCGRGGNL